MALLPVVERELRVASRKRSTPWIRIIAASVALTICGGFLVLSTVSAFSFGSATLGKALFGTLTWLGVAAVLAAGLFFTSDCLSAEKRDGTLGFLFLTDLRGYDVVLGKLVATSLRGFYTLLALFPILAVTLLMGGVTGAQFWMTALALVNALFMSLAAGLFVSAISRDSQRALAATLFLLVVIVGVGPAVDAIIASVTAQPFKPVLSLSSAAFVFMSADAWGPTPFWWGLLVNQIIAWGLISAASVVLPRTWQERATKTSITSVKWAQWLKYGGTKRRAFLRRELLEKNPVLWLACRERWQSASLWVATILVAAGLILVFPTENLSKWTLVCGFVSGGFSLVLYLGIASQAGRFFVEAKRSGLMELLQVTPLAAHQIVSGQWHALVRLFGMPLLLWLAVQGFGTYLQQQQTWSQLGVTSTASSVTTTNTASSTPATNGSTTVTVFSLGGPASSSTAAILGITILGTLTLVANLAALAWFGMWMGLNSKNNSLSTLKTILFVQVIPWFVISFASTLIVALFLIPGVIRKSQAAQSQFMGWYPLITAGAAMLLCLVKDVGLSLWARRKLYSQIREQPMRTSATLQTPRPPPLPTASA